MSKFLRFWAVMAAIFIPWFAKAQAQPQTASVGTEVSEAERMKVKKRLYPGGRDEEPLQVQTQLVAPSKSAVSADELPDSDAD